LFVVFGNADHNFVLLDQGFLVMAVNGLEFD